MEANMPHYPGPTMQMWSPHRLSSVQQALIGVLTLDAIGRCPTCIGEATRAMLGLYRYVMVRPIVGPLRNDV